MPIFSKTSSSESSASGSPSFGSPARGAPRFFIVPAMSYRIQSTADVDMLA